MWIHAENPTAVTPGGAMVPIVVHGRAQLYSWEGGEIWRVGPMEVGHGDVIPNLLSTVRNNVTVTLPPSPNPYSNVGTIR